MKKKRKVEDDAREADNMDGSARSFGLGWGESDEWWQQA
jgi:hypothetical protein